MPVKDFAIVAQTRFLGGDEVSEGERQPPPTILMMISNRQRGPKALKNVTA